MGTKATGSTIISIFFFNYFLEIKKRIGSYTRVINLCLEMRRELNSVMGVCVCVCVYSVCVEIRERVVM